MTQVQGNRPLLFDNMGVVCVLNGVMGAVGTMYTDTVCCELT